VIVYTLIYILVIAFNYCAFAIDTDSTNVPYPHGIVANGLNTSVEQNGTTFNITGGTIKDKNLFHSFDTFNIHSDEQAIFHDKNIMNTIARVNGGQISWLNGKLTSHAKHFYLINPFGFVFGPDVSLDLSGSFHPTTAHYLRMGNSETFQAMSVDEEMLSISSPTAFGFLPQSMIASIGFQGTDQRHSTINIAANQDISLIGGNIFCDKMKIYAPGGTIFIASHLSEGEIVPDIHAVSHILSDESKIHLSGQSVLDVSGSGAGNVFIVADSFEMNNSQIQANTLADKPGGDIHICSRSIYINDQSYILSQTFGSGNSGNIILVAEDIFLLSEPDNENLQLKENKILTGSRSLSADAGNSGYISIQSNMMTSVNTLIASYSDGPGFSGNITIKGSEDIDFKLIPLFLPVDPDDSDPFDQYAEGFYAVQTQSAGIGKSGDIFIDAENITFDYGTGIKTISLQSETSGNIDLEASGAITFFNARIDSLNGGNIDMNAMDIEFNNGALIVSGTDGVNDGGNIMLHADQSIFFHDSAWQASSYKGILFRTEWRTTGIGLFTRSQSPEAGRSGNLQITANQIQFKNGAHIISETSGAGNGGQLDLHAQDTISFTGQVNNGFNGWGSGIGIRAIDTGRPSALRLIANQILFSDGGFISARSTGAGAINNISIFADEFVHFTGHSSFEDVELKKGFGSTGISLISEYSSPMESQEPGKLLINASQILFDETATIYSATHGTQAACDIQLNALKTIIFKGISSDNFGSSGISLITSGTEMSAGAGGNLFMNAQDILFDSGSFIAANTYGNGNGPNVTLKALGTVQFSDDSGQRWLNSDQLISIIDDNSKWDDIYEGKWHHMNHFVLFSILLMSPQNMITRDYDLLIPSTIFMETHHTGENAGDAGQLLIEAENIIFKNGAGIACDTRGKGNAGKVSLIATNEITFSGHGSDPGLSSNLYAEVDSRSNGGEGTSVTLEASTINLHDGAKILSTAFGPGRGGDISIVAHQNLFLDGTDSKGWSSTIASGSSPKENCLIAGDGGDIFIQGGHLILLNGAQIASSAIAPEGFQSGNAGKININVKSMTLSGVNPFGENEDGFGSGIYARAMGNGKTGRGGTLEISAEQIDMSFGAVISTSTNNDAQAGEIVINTHNCSIHDDSSHIELLEPAESQLDFQNQFNWSDSFSRSGIYSHSLSTKQAGGQSGTICIITDKLSLFNNALITTSSYGGGDAGNIDIIGSGLIGLTNADISSESHAEYFGGAAGKIRINNSGSLKLKNNSTLSTSAQSSGGGQININTTDTTLLINSDITSSVHMGENKGGDISLYSNFMVINHGKIQANADLGDGGAIFIHTDYYFKSSDSRVEATSRRGNDGQVTIEAPDIDISSFLADLNINFLDATQWMITPCELQNTANRSRLIIRGLDARPAIPGDLQASPPACRKFLDHVGNQY